MLVGKHACPGKVKRLRDYADRRPMVVLTWYRKQASTRIQFRQRTAKGRNITPHRRWTRKIIAGQEDEFGTLAVNCFNRLFEPCHVFVTIEMKIAYLTGNNVVKLWRQMPYRQ